MGLTIFARRMEALTVVIRLQAADNVANAWRDSCGKAKSG
jgi:hypothetical protein